MSRLFGIAVLVSLMLTMPSITLAATSDAPTARQLGAEFRDTCSHVYSSLEQAPVRHWGTQELVRPFWDIQADLNRKAGAEPLAHNFVERFTTSVNTQHSKILDFLKLEPVGTIEFTSQGRPELKIEQEEIIRYQDVPGTLVLRVEPSAGSGSVSISCGEDSDESFETITVNRRNYLADCVTLPITPEKTGLRTVRINITTDKNASRASIPLMVKPSSKLEIKITRRRDNQPLTSKVYVESSDGRLYVPTGEKNYRTQDWYAYYQPRFSYVSGDCSIPVPPGKYRVTAIKGHEYRPTTIEVSTKAGESTTCKLVLEQLYPMEENGWYSGDMHTHYRGFINKMLRGENVNFVGDTVYSSSRPMELGIRKGVSDDNYILFGQQEIEHWNFGNSFYINLPRTVVDPIKVDREMTPMFFYDKQCHELGGTTLRWVRGRQFSPKGGGQQQPEVAVDVALGYLDVWQVLNNTLQEALDRPTTEWTGKGWTSTAIYERTYETWYALMNCGLRLPASAGTSFGRLSTLGFNRVYTKIEGDPSLPKFAHALKKGDGFVSNGPLLWLKVNGQLPGSTIDLEEGGKVSVQIRLASAYPVGLVELVKNGKVVAEKELEDFDGQWEFQTDIEVQEPCWFGARCFGRYQPRYPHSISHNQFAHTNPAFVTIAGNKPVSPSDAERFVEEIDALIDFTSEIPEKLQRETRRTFEKAREYYAEMSQRR